MKIAIIGEMHPDGWETLKKNDYKPYEITNFSKDNLKKELQDTDGIILRTAANLTSDVLKDCNNIKIIARHGVGYDNVDLEFLNKNKISVSGCLPERLLCRESKKSDVRPFVRPFVPHAHFGIGF